jgi:hypothetical protein
MRPSILLLTAVVLALPWARQSTARLLLDAPLDRLDEACQIVGGRHPSRSNCTKAFLASTTCVESWPVERQHLTQTVAPCPAGRPGMCTDFTVRWCENSIYPQKGGCYRSEYAHNGMMGYEEYWFGFSLFLPSNYSVDVGSIHFQVHGNPNADVHEAHRNPMFALLTDPAAGAGSGGNWQMRARGDSRRNITRANRTYEWDHTAELGPVRPGEWEHFVYHTRYTPTSGGFIELWRNGKKLVSLTDTGTAYNDTLGPYFKFGIYAASWGTMANPPPANSSSNTLIIGGLKQGDNTSDYTEVDTSHVLGNEAAANIAQGFPPMKTGAARLPTKT